MYWQVRLLQKLTEGGKIEFKPEIMSLGFPVEPLQDGVLCVLNTDQGEVTDICSEGFF